MMNKITPVTKFAAVVVFDTHHKQYDFWSNIFLVPGDKVVVNTVNGLAIAKVVAVKGASKYANKWVVTKIDLSEHEERKKRTAKIEQLKGNVITYTGNITSQQVILADTLKEIDRLERGL